VRSLFERTDHLAERAIEHLSGDRLEDARFEREVDAEIHVGAALPVGREAPAVVEIFERTFDIIDHDLARPLLPDAGGEGLLERLEADHQVRDHQRLAVRSNPRCGHPGQELAIAADVRNQVEHLLRAVGQVPCLGMTGHASP
jgi:hypothetical protein